MDNFNGYLFIILTEPVFRIQNITNGPFTFNGPFYFNEVCLDLVCLHL